MERKKEDKKPSQLEQKKQLKGEWVAMVEALDTTGSLYERCRSSGFTG